MGKRAKDVAREIAKRLTGHDGMENAEHYLRSLPEFQPGRELTAEDLRECYPPGLYLDSHFGMIASKLNQIRAPKTESEYVKLCADQFAEIHKLKKERDELKGQCDTLCMERDDQSEAADYLKKDRDELAVQLESARAEIRKQGRELGAQDAMIQSLKSQPSVGVTKEQVRYALRVVGVDQWTDETYEKISAALSQVDWIDPKEKMPLNGQAVEFVGDCWGEQCSGWFHDGKWVGCDKRGVGRDFCGVLRWMPRYIPEPWQADGGSECVKEMLAYFKQSGIASESSQFIKGAIEIVKKWEDRK